MMPPFRRNLLYFAVLASMIVGLFLLTSTEPQTRVGLLSGLKENVPGLAFSTNTRKDDFSIVAETTMPAGTLVPGFALLDRLYLRNGTFFIVSNSTAFPPRSDIISRPLDIGANHDLEPTDKELRFITSADATEILGKHAIPIEGFTMIVYDTEQFMNRFYHWWGEMVLGTWRVYSALDAFTQGAENPPFPARVILPHIFGNEWRDAPGVNAGLMRACFPSTNIEKSDYWDDLTLLDKTVVFERAMIISRATAHRHPLSTSWSNMLSSAMTVNTSAKFWEPIRHATISNLLGYLPELDSRGLVVAPPSSVSSIPVVTYISRQGGGRRLREEDHEGLVRALKELEWTGICQVYVAVMEKMSLVQQVEVMAASTVVVGVHGNGLTHQLWMPPSARSTVIEIFPPKSYLSDYEILARNLGHRHYAIWNDTPTTFPKDIYHEGIEYAEDFNTLSIPVHGPAVAQLIRQCLTEFA
ncbi:hypothetical protein Hypma_000336 [Hypsizygus marmoreus]|uniref:Glycosyltransferase 61 catalytic domain-containing protein n=1 Tax=Hypsizygus marmoreus TaxID=39966 RepID=A0A369JB01_HYPMA|nr:hypothetical protein Hypma_000336 [Hypsizygus marmoreus]